MSGLLLDILGIVSPILSVFIALIAFRNNQKAGDDKQGREMGMILTEIGYVKSQMDAITRKLEHHEERYTNLTERVSAVEQSTKSAHHRIDNLAQ